MLLSHSATDGDGGSLTCRHAVRERENFCFLGGGEPGSSSFAASLPARFELDPPTSVDESAPDGDGSAAPERDDSPRLAGEMSGMGERVVGGCGWGEEEGVDVVRWEGVGQPGGTLPSGQWSRARGGTGEAPTEYRGGRVRGGGGGAGVPGMVEEWMAQLCCRRVRWRTRQRVGSRPVRNEVGSTDRARETMCP